MPCCITDQKTQTRPVFVVASNFPFLWVSLELRTTGDARRNSRKAVDNIKNAICYGGY